MDRAGTRKTKFCYQHLCSGRICGSLRVRDAMVIPGTAAESCSEERARAGPARTGRRRGRSRDPCWGPFRRGGYEPGDNPTTQTQRARALSTTAGKDGRRPEEASAAASGAAGATVTGERRTVFLLGLAKLQQQLAHARDVLLKLVRGATAVVRRWRQRGRVSSGSSNATEQRAVDARDVNQTQYVLPRPIGLFSQPLLQLVVRVPVPARGSVSARPASATASGATGLVPHRSLMQVARAALLELVQLLHAGAGAGQSARGAGRQRVGAADATAAPRAAHAPLRPVPVALV